MMAQKDYYAAFLITDSVMKLMKEGEKDKQIVKLSSLPNGLIPDGFTPFCWAAIVGEKDFENRKINSIKGDKKEFTVKASRMMGAISLPWEKTFTIGDDFTAPDIFEYKSKDLKKQGYATITQIIYAKTAKDMIPILNWGKTVETNEWCRSV